MKLILLGAPGSGKGSVAKKIASDFQIPQISTGDLFRKLLKEESDLAKRVKKIMKAGLLVPDEITVELLKKRIEEKDCQNGFILDGFPRTIAQAKALEQITQIDGVILVELPYRTIIERLSSRRTCSSCGEIYSALTYKEETCAKCNGKIIQRDDDKPETIKNRLEVYDKNTSPLINFYSAGLFKVSNEGSLEETYKSVKSFLEDLEVEKSE